MANRAHTAWSGERAAALAPHLRAWARHRVFFGPVCTPRRLAEAAAHATAALVEGPAPEETPPHCRVIAQAAGDWSSYRFPHGHRDPMRRGMLNPGFLHAETIARGCLEQLPASVQTVVLPVARVYPTEAYTAADFLEQLTRTLGGLPRGRRYAVQVRNAGFLLPAYFACLREQGALHVLHEAPELPPLIEQVLQPGVWEGEGALLRLAPGGGGETALAVLEAVRRSVEAGRELAVLFGEEADGEGIGVLETVMGMLDPDLARLSPFKQRAA